MKVAVIIPAYKVSAQILSVIAGIDNSVYRIYVVDDCCPESSGEFVKKSISDPRVVVIMHEKNLGVGGAVKSGYQAAIDDGCEVLVKIDGDGQMDPKLLSSFVAPILSYEADYVKGNRFYSPESLRGMPKKRVFGNACLSMLNKISSGYWQIFDPTNGYTALHVKAATMVPWQKIDDRYFFESDLLFRLGTINAVVQDLPMDSKYEDEESNLNDFRAIPEFAYKNLRNALKRIVYNYYLRGMSLASFELPLGLLLLISSFLYGTKSWITASRTGVPAATGTVVSVAMMGIIGVQMVLAFLAADTSSDPSRSLSSRMRTPKK